MKDAIKNILHLWAIDSQKDANAKKLEQHLARIALYELRGVDALYPDVKEKCEKLIVRMQELEKPIEIFETFRSVKKQNGYFAKGRTKKGSIITNAEGLESYHQFGLGFDVIFKDHRWNPPQWEWWASLGEEGEKLGLVWGGDFKDWGHFEWHPNFEWIELKKYFEVEISNK